MAAAVPGNANEFIEQQLQARLLDMESHFKADILAFVGPIYWGVDRLLRISIEGVRAKSKRRQLVILLTTSGGDIEVVHRMVDTIRTHYRIVDFVIPDYAYSAGTVFAMSGDNIHMDYYSRLGPIDPQVQIISNGVKKWVPALGYLEQYNRLITKAQKGTISLAEVQLLIDGFDQAELYQYEQARELSIALLKEWLVKYKFKKWKRTETQHRPVDRRLREQTANRVAEELNKVDRWHIHGYGISMKVLEEDPHLRLRIDDFGKNPNRAEKIRGYHELLRDYMMKMSCIGAIHTARSYEPYMIGV